MALLFLRRYPAMSTESESLHTQQISVCYRKTGSIHLELANSILIKIS